MRSRSKKKPAIAAIAAEQKPIKDRILEALGHKEMNTKNLANWLQVTQSRITFNTKTMAAEGLIHKADRYGPWTLGDGKNYRKPAPEPLPIDCIQREQTDRGTTIVRFPKHWNPSANGQTHGRQLYSASSLAGIF